MPLPEKIDDHVAQGLRRLTDVFRGLPNIAMTLSSTAIDDFGGDSLGTIGALEQVQVMENVFFDLLEKRDLPRAEGQQLDNIGEILELPRNPLTLDDESYRSRLTAKVTLNRSSGEAERIINLLGVLTASSIIRVVEHFPASAIIYFDGEVLTSNAELADTMQAAKAAGVRLDLVQFDPDDYFGFASDPNAKGYGVGKYAGIVQ